MRLFLAIPLPAALRDELGERAARLRDEVPRARWVRSEAMHLTLHFFGDRDGAQAEAIVGALEPAVARQPRFRLETAEVGAFPRRSRPQVIWLGLEASEALQELHRNVTSALRDLGEAIEERPFRGHVTLLRCKARFRRRDVDVVARGFEELEGREVPVEEVVVFESHLGAGGARHEAVARLRLG